MKRANLFLYAFNNIEVQNALICMKLGFHKELVRVQTLLLILC